MNLWSAGAYTLNCYASKDNSISDKYYFLCDDVINDMIVTSIHPASQPGSVVVLACNDNTIKFISDEGEQLYSTVLEASPSSISLATSEETAINSESTIICYGLNNGNIGAIELGADEAIVLWEVNCSEEVTKAPISIIKVAALKEKPHLIVARDDSTIEVHRFQER